MRNIIGKKCGSVWAIGYNLMKNDDRYIITYCECGKYFEVLIDEFLKEDYTHKECKENKKSSIINKTYGKWKAVERVENRKTMPYYKCVCECGNSKEIAYSNLISGASKSCGCDKPAKEKKEKVKGEKGRPNKTDEPNFNQLIIKFKGKMAEEWLKHNDPRYPGYVGPLEPVKDAEPTAPLAVAVVAPWTPNA